MIQRQTVMFIILAALLTLSPPAFSADQGALPDGFSPWLGGCGGLYLYAGKGELTVEVAKQDLNIRGNKTYLRAVFFGPDRSVIDEQWINDDGRPAESGPGPVGMLKLSTRVERPGVYGVNITVSEDRYGENMSWAFKTNCPRYLVETSRGHKDARHLEPLVLRSPGRSADVAFLPSDGPVSVEVTGLPAGTDPLKLIDVNGRQIARLEMSPEGAAKYMSAGSSDGTPWRLHLPEAEAVIEVDGVTRWENDDPNMNISLWTPDAKSWFPFHENRWLLFPYRRIAYGQAGEKDSLEFTVFNNGKQRKKIRLSLESEKGTSGFALSSDEVSLDPQESGTVTLRYTIPAGSGEKTCYVRASCDDNSGFSTWSSVTLRKGTAPAESPLDIPLRFQPYRHQNEQFGYLPKFPMDNQVYFSPENKPYISARDGIFHFENGEWLKTTSAKHGENGSRINIAPIVSKIAFDGEGGVYTVGRSSGMVYLFYSADDGRTFSAWPVSREGSFDIETFTGHNKESGPPPLARYIQTAADPNLIWRKINDLELFFPEKKSDGSIAIGEPVLVSKLSIGLSVHSGIPSTIVSRGDKVHITWGEATEPEAKAPGVPTYVATYDRTAKQLSEPALIGYGPPANDVHNTPCITMDSKGFLHVLIGTHGRTFKYSKSLEPNTGAKGWTETADIGEGLRQTYVGMVCDQHDTIHLVFRLWLQDNGVFPAGYYANLAYMSKKPGTAWSEARPLVVAPFSEYSIFYHRLTIDRKDRLFLSYDYWSTFWFYRIDHRGSRRSLMHSDDNGVSWTLTPDRILESGK